MKKPKTKQGYGQNLHMIEGVFGDVPVPQITRPVLEKFYNKMHKRTPSSRCRVARDYARH
jgi:hypothetical protein